ncbi:MAG: RmuC domain protein [Parcubacteria group bacterium GW2011_GWA2_47_16]|nr:MAG: RmuC domain protein [Parcubacteria group bacterium GW2011_GWA2_47_16]
MTILYLLLAMAVGVFVGYFICLKIKDKEIELTIKNSEDQKKYIGQFDDKFKSIASDILRQSASDFVTAAKKDLDNTKEVVRTTLVEKEKGFEKIAQGVDTLIKNIESKVVNLEAERAKQITTLGESVKRVLEVENKIGDSVNNLKTALASGNAIRGRWGESLLKNVLDESGMQEGVHYFTQETLHTEGGQLRPDVIVNMPGGTRLAIDSKANLTEYLSALEEKDESKRKEHISKFVAHIKDTVQNLSSKEYQKYLDSAIPYVIMFIPSESAFRVALQTKPELFLEAQKKKVIMASPTTITPLLILIALSWEQNKISENAHKVTTEVVDLGKRLQTFIGHVIDIGDGIEKAGTKFNAAAISWDRNVVPKLNSLKEIGVDLNPIEEIKSIEVALKLPVKKLN